MQQVQAFDTIRLVDKLPLKICAIATWDDQFMISTVSTKSEAHLLVYKVVQSTEYDKVFEARLDRTLKKFTNKPIVSLAVVSEHDLFLALTTDGELHCAHLSSYQLNPTALPRLRGCTCFAVDWNKLKGYDMMLRLCVAVKKKLLVYVYANGSFIQAADLILVDNPKMVSWIGDGLMICIKKDLFFMTLDGTLKELFPIGQNRAEPCMLPIMRGDKQEMLVLNDEKQISLDTSVQPTQPAALTWTDYPMCIEHVHPYIIGVLPRCIEVRALEHKLLVQTIKMSEQFKDSIKFIVHNRLILVASHTQVYKLEPKAYDKQVQQFVQNKQFDLALEVAELTRETENERKSRREEILRRYAFYLFNQQSFEKSLKYYLEIKEDPVQVIGLYPHLLPSDLRQSLSRPSTPATLTGEDLKKGTECLINYLTQMRYTEQLNLSEIQKTGELEEAKKLEARLQLIDTTLLKCYIKTGNNTLIGSLVRLRENHLHLAESERVLRNEEKFQELVQLYKTKGQHKNALDLLYKFQEGPYAALSGVWSTIDYLQNLGCENIDLILEYSKWVLNKNTDDGIKIFTEEIGEVENLPREKVFKHLSDCAPLLRIPYLEHIIHRWKDRTPQFHNELILIYMRKIVKDCLPKYKQNLKGRPRAKAGEEPDQLGFLRSKLLNFLQSSRYYEPESLISKFPPEDLFEERALLLGKLGRHEVALAIYAHILKDPKMAEDYCRRMYDPEKEGNREVYFSLIKAYLYPPSLNDLGIRLKEQHSQPVKDITTAMTILATYHEKIDTAKVMSMLPDDISIHDIRKFLMTVLEENMVTRRRVHVSQSLYLAEHLQVEKSRIQEQCPHFIIDDFTQCSICKKKLGTSAFARYASGALAHLYCYQSEMDKQEQTDEFYS